MRADEWYTTSAGDHAVWHAASLGEPMPAVAKASTIPSVPRHHIEGVIDAAITVCAHYLESARG